METDQRQPAENDAPDRVEAILRRYGVAERDIGSCCDDLSPHLRPWDMPRGRRYSDASVISPAASDR